MKLRLGIPARFRSPARDVLEQFIIPYYASGHTKSRLLFVGSDWYTKHYQRTLRKHEYWTIDPDPHKTQYGAKNHIVDYLENLTHHFDSGYFDTIICNGVLGFGLFDKDPVEKSLNACFSCLRDGGTFVLGWEGSSEVLSFPLEECVSLQRFSSFYFPPLATSNYTTRPQYPYVYSFFQKR